MSTDTKKIWFSYAARDYQAMISILEEKALQGWRMKKMNPVIATLENVEPKEIKYFADIFLAEDEPDDFSHPEFRDWINEREEMGYKFAGQKGQLVIFHNDTEKSPKKPLVSETALEEKSLKSRVASPSIIGTLLSLIFFIVIYYELFFGHYYSAPLYNNSSLVFFGLFPLLVLLPIFLEEMRKLRFHNRLKESVFKEPPFLHNTINMAKVRRYYLDLPIIFFLLLIFLASLMDYGMIRVLLFIGIFIIFGFFTRNIRLKISHKRIILIIFIMLLPIFGYLSGTAESDRRLNPEKIPENLNIFSLSNSNHSDSETRNVRFGEQSSIVIPTSIIFSESIDDEFFNVDFYELASPRFSSYFFNRITRAWESGETIDSQLHNFEKVMMISEQNYLIKQGVFIVRIFHNTELPQEELFAMVEAYLKEVS